MKRSFWQHVKHFKANSLLVKDFVLIFSLSSLIFLAVILGFYTYYSRLTADAVSVSNLNALARVQDFIDLVSKEAERLSIRIGRDAEIEQMLRTEQLETGSYQTVERIDAIRRILSTSSIASDYLYAIELYSFNNDYFISSAGISAKLSRTGISVPKMPDDKSIWVQVVQEDYDNRYYLAYFQKLFVHGGGKPDGLLAVLVDLDAFGRQIQGFSVKSYEEIFLLDETDTVLYSFNRDNIGRPAEDVALLARYLKKPGQNILRFDNQKLFVTEVQSDYKKWRCISFAISEHYYNNETGRLWTLLLSSLGCSLVIAVLGAIWISSRMFEPINLLLDLVQEESPSKISRKRKQSAEFEIIISGILDKYEQNNQMKQQLLSKQVMLNKAQNIALQAQINPHFLYNTLENINWCAMALTKGSNQVSDMIVMLSKLLRFYMKTEEALISVQDEVAYAKLYMDILELRFNHAYRVIWDIDEELCDLKIVKTTLQPLLENAVNYGVSKGDGDDFIQVRGYAAEHCGIIEIINSGPAITDADIQRINEEMEKDDIRENTSIGMSNVNRRIKLHFGTQYGLSVSHTAAGYTCVTVSFPLGTIKEDE